MKRSARCGYSGNQKLLPNIYISLSRRDIRIPTRKKPLIKITEEAIVPKEAVKTTPSFFIIGTLPILVPFFAGIMWHAEPLIPAIVAFILALIIVSIAGLFIAVLSGKEISEKIIHNVLIIVGACSATYLIGLAARVLFGIEAGH